MSIIIYSIIAIGYLFGFYLIFPKANRKAWEGLIPGYNFYILTKIIQKPWWWTLLLIFPGVNVLMLMVFNSNLATVFNKRELKDQVLAILFPFVMFPLWGREDLKFVGPIDRTKVKKSSYREWGDAIVFCGHCRKYHPNVFLRSLHYSNRFYGKDAAYWRLSFRKQNGIWS